MTIIAERASLVPMRTIFLALTLIAAAWAADDVSGDWNYVMSGGPNGDTPALMSLKLEGTAVTGTFDFGGRKLTISQGSFENGVLKMTVKRDRPEGGAATYAMTAKVTGDSMEGTTTTNFMGGPATAPWKAKRKK